MEGTYLAMLEAESNIPQGNNSNQTTAGSTVTKPDNTQASSPSGSRKRSYHSQTASTDSLTHSSEDDASKQKAKRPCLELKQSDASAKCRSTYWVALSIVTAGSQGADLGRDQTPIVQLSAVLGSVKTASIMDKFTANIRPERYTSSPSDPVDSSQTTMAIVSKQGTDASSHRPSSPNVDGLENLIRPTEGAVKLAKLDRMSMEDWAACPGLLSVMEVFTKWLQKHSVSIGDNVDLQNADLVTVTDGPLPLRSVLHPEAVNRGLPLAQLNRPPWGAYVDLNDWCRSVSIGSIQQSTESTHLKEQKPEQNVRRSSQVRMGLSQLAAEMGLAPEEYLPTVDKMARIVETLLKMNCPIPTPNIVRTGYEHKVLPRSLEIPDNQVVEIRQVPWSATPLVIATFFSGLNVIPGGVAIRLTDGRRSNTAIVAFETDQQAKLALARHQHQLISTGLEDQTQQGGQQHHHQRGGHLQKRQQVPLIIQLQLQQVQQQLDQGYTQKSIFLQVFSASGRDFVQCAGCDQQNVTEFLSQLTQGEQVVVRIRGLPYTTTKQQILDFFAAANASVLFSSQGVFLVSYPDKRPTGDAFVLFGNDAVVGKALKRHKDYLGDRYVEVFKSSPSEMVQVCKNVSHQKSNLTANSNKPPTSLLDLQTHPVNSMTGYPHTNGLAGLGHPLFGTDSLAVLSMLQQQQTLHSTQQQTLGGSQTVCASPATLIPPVSHFLPLGSAAAGLEALSSLNQLSMSTQFPGQLGLFKSFPLLTSVPTEAGAQVPVLSSSFATGGGQLPRFRDPMDPTDPECPFARPLPPDVGATALVQMCGLPLETSRHDVRRYLGPANLAKVYRMCKMDNTDHLATSSWLISLLNITEATQVIRDLTNRHFVLDQLPNQPRVYTNIPTFAVFHVGVDKKLSIVPLHEQKTGIPLNRIHSCAAGQSVKTPSDKFRNGVTNSRPGNLVTMPTGSESPNRQTALNRPTGLSSAEELNYTKLLQGLLRQQNQQLASLAGSTNLDLSRYPPGTASVPVTTYSTAGLHQPGANRQPVGGQLLLSSLAPLSLGLTVPSACGLDLLTPSPAAAGQLANPPEGLFGSTVVISGAPVDATGEELISLFQPMFNLMPVRPQFALYQQHQNGTADFLAFLNGPFEAQVASALCPHGSLRGHKYATLITSLSPGQTPALLPRQLPVPPHQSVGQSVRQLPGQAVTPVNGNSTAGTASAGLLGTVAPGFPVGFPFWSPS